MVKPLFEWQEPWFTMTKLFFIAALVKTLVSWWFPSSAQKWDLKPIYKWIILPQLWDLAEDHLQTPQFYINPRFSIVFPGLWHGSPTKFNCPNMPVAPSLQDLWLRASWPEGSWRYSNPQTDAELCFQHGTVFVPIWWCLLLCSTAFAGVQCFFLFLGTILL